MNQKGLAPIAIMGTVIFFLIIAGVFGYHFINQNKKHVSNEQEQNINQDQNKDLTKEGDEEDKDNQQAIDQDSSQQLIEKKYINDLIPPEVVSPYENSILTLTSKGISLLVYPSAENSIVHIYIWKGEEALFEEKPFREIKMSSGEGLITLSKTDEPFKDGYKYTFAAQTCLDDKFTQCGLWGNPIHFSIKMQNLNYQTIETSTYTVNIPEDWKKEAEGIFNGQFAGFQINIKTVDVGKNLVDMYNGYYSNGKFIDFKERETKTINGKTFYLLKATTGASIHNVALVSKNSQEFFKISLVELIFNYDEEILNTILNTFTIKD
ncbi:MAG: hypothetical protein PHD93_01385 [Candidatus Pacebacteria bacterium]|nr:hypothetical protein [Candidatus Paceibacterota bacterium]